MINIYCENEVFGKYTVFDTDTGKTNIISEKDFNMICNTPGDRRVFRHDNVTHTIFPRIIYFQIIRKCNLNCPYCFISAEEQGEEVPWSDIKDLADYFEKQGLMEVRLTGGEPTIHTRFEEIVDEFRNRNIYVSVATNGCWSKSVLEFFKSKKNIFLII